MRKTNAIRYRKYLNTNCVIKLAKIILQNPKKYSKFYGKDHVYSSTVKYLKKLSSYPLIKSLTTSNTINIDSWINY